MRVSQNPAVITVTGDVPVQHDQQHTASRGEGLKTRLGERIGLQFTILVGTDQVLLLLDVTVQDGKVEVGGGLVDTRITVVGLEDICRKSAPRHRF